MGMFTAESEWLKSLREAGARAAREAPVERNPLYVKHHIAPTIDIDWLMERAEPSKDAALPAPFEGLASAAGEPLIIHVDASPAVLYVPEGLSKRGVIIKPLGEALMEDEELTKHVLTRGPKPDEDRAVGMLYAALNSGVFIHVPTGVREQVKIRSMWLSGSSRTATCAASLIIAGERTDVSVVEEYHSYDGRGEKKFMSHLVNIICGDESRVKHALLNNLDDDTELCVYKRSYSEKDANTIWVGALLGGSLTRYRVDNMLVGSGSRSDALEVVMGSGSEKFDVAINLNHIAPSTTGRVMARGVGMDKSRIILKGIIRIEKPARQTGAYLAEHAMLLSPDARADAIPGLEIESDNVKATHSASVAQVDPEHVWYLMSRGIPRDEALKMITLGFFEPVISEVDITEVRWSMRYLLERKWLGGEEAELDPERLMDIYVEPEDVGKKVEDIFGSHYKYVYKREHQ